MPDVASVARNPALVLCSLHKYELKYTLLSYDILNYDVCSRAVFEMCGIKAGKCPDGIG